MKKKANNNLNKTKLIIVDPNSYEEYFDDENVFTIHPSKVKFLGHMEKESVDKIIVRNTTASNLKSISFFFFKKVLAPNTLLEVEIYQPISVMQSLDANEIEANAKLQGFVDIQTHEIEFFTKEGEKDIKLKTTKLSMVRPEITTSKK